MDSKEPGRRRFLKNGAVLAGVAMGAIRPARSQTLEAKASPDLRPLPPPKGNYSYGQRSRFEISSRSGTNGNFGYDLPSGSPRDFGFRTPLQSSVGIITPASLHFMIAHGYDPPDINPAEHHLMIHGLVERPLIFTLEDLQRLPSVSRVHFVECNGNSTPSGPGFSQAAARDAKNATVQQTHGLTSCSEWTGVPLSTLLGDAGLKKEAKWIVAEGAEKGMHSKSIPLEKAMDDVLVAYGQNGEAIRPEQGYPLRLLAPGWEGINSVKWLRRIKVVDKPYMGMRESTKYPSVRRDGTSRWFQFELGPKSVITRPSGGQQLKGKGFYEITGLAWSGGGAIKRVEVSTDGGKTWKDAEIQGPIHRKAHTRFRLPWNWDGNDAVLQSRTTDERGEIQPALAELNKFYGVTFNAEYFQSTNEILGHFNAIQPWRVNRDGSVENAIFS
jgi:sulfane dehydrogenase subunit SoxC